MLTLAEMHEHMRRIFDGMMLKRYWRPEIVPDRSEPVVVDGVVEWYGTNGDFLLHDMRALEGQLVLKSKYVRNERQRMFLFRHGWAVSELAEGERWLKLTQVEATDTMGSYWTRTDANRQDALRLETLNALDRRLGREEEDITL